MSEATPAMLKWFARADKTGRIFYSGPRGFGRRAWERCMERAAALGFVTANAWGEYDLTDAGRRAACTCRQSGGTT